MQPAFEISSAKGQYAEVFAQRLISLSYTDAAGWEADSLTVVLDDAAPFLALPPEGSKIKLALGYVGDLVDFGEFTVNAYQCQGLPNQLTLSAQAVDYAGQLTAVVQRSWRDITLADLVVQIADKHGYQAAIHARYKAVPVVHEDQNESDQHFLTRLAKLHGATFKLADGRLIFAPRRSGETAGAKAMPEITLQPQNCGSWDLPITLRDVWRSVRADYWQIPEAKAGTVVVGEGRPQHVLREQYPAEIEARAAAQSVLDASAVGSVSGSVNGLAGAAHYRAETYLKLEGFRPGVAANWVINQATHEYSRQSGYVCNLSVATQVRGDG